MSKLTRILSIGLLATVGLTDVASAQYYPPRDYPPRGPDPYYAPPPGYYPPPRPGYRCDAVLRTPYGRRQLICDIVEPKPLGAGCVCPPPPPPPGYPPGPYLRGRVVP